MLLLLYVALDFSDPSVPGIFFFESEHFFVDAVITKANTQGPVISVAAPVPLSVMLIAPKRDSRVPLQIRHTAPSQVPRAHLKRDLTSSSSSASASEEAPH